MSAVYIRSSSSERNELLDPIQVIVDDATIKERHAAGKTIPDDWVEAKHTFLQRARAATNYDQVLRDFETGLSEKPHAATPREAPGLSSPTTSLVVYKQTLDQSTTDSSQMSQPPPNLDRLLAQGLIQVAIDKKAVAARPCEDWSNMTMEQLVEMGVIEFVSHDQYEHMGLEVSLRPRRTEHFTHCELHPSLLFGVASKSPPSFMWRDGRMNK